MLLSVPGDCGCIRRANRGGWEGGFSQVVGGIAVAQLPIDRVRVPCGGIVIELTAPDVAEPTRPRPVDPWPGRRGELGRAMLRGGQRGLAGALGIERAVVSGLQEPRQVAKKQHRAKAGESGRADVIASYAESCAPLPPFQDGESCENATMAFALRAIAVHVSSGKGEIDVVTAFEQRSLPMRSIGGVFAVVTIFGLTTAAMAAGPCCGNQAVSPDYGGYAAYCAPACAAPCYGMVPGCCEFPPSCCDNVWDGYCQEPRGLDALRGYFGCRGYRGCGSGAGLRACGPVEPACCPVDGVEAVDAVGSTGAGIVDIPAAPSAAH